jgi:hypothetical protein
MKGDIYGTSQERPRADGGRNERVEKLSPDARFCRLCRRAGPLRHLRRGYHAMGERTMEPLNQTNEDVVGAMMAKATEWAVAWIAAQALLSYLARLVR